MSDSIKFGPEWLRNSMSNDTGGLSSSTGMGSGGGLSYNSQSTRFPLAEYRYGREEMLSLYDKNFKIPELLPKYNKLYIEKMQCPLALLPPSADEEAPRGLTPIGGLSGDRSALGLTNSSSGSALGGMSSTLGMSGRGIRGTSIDRGRGRASRGGLYHPSLGSYQRSGFMYDEDSRGIGARGERSWSERNGSETDWNATANGSPSPRKDFTSLRSGSSGESWRRSRVEDDGTILNGTANEGWRTSTSSSTVRSTSWRGGENDPGSSAGGFSSDSSGPPRLERSKSTQGSLQSREHPPDSSNHPGSGINRRFGLNASWDEDNLPEWAMDEPIEGGGSFDATGAFLGADDKNMGEKQKISDTLQPTSQPNEKGDQKSMEPACDNKATDKHGKNAAEIMRTKEKLETSNSNALDDLPNESFKKDDSLIIAKEKELNPNESEVKPINDEKTSLNNQQQVTSMSVGSSYKNTSTYIASEKREAVPKSIGITDKTNVVSDSTPIDRLQEVAEDIEKLIMDDDQSCNESDNEALLTSSHIHARDAPKHPIVNDVLNEKTKETDRWFYRDPQGKVQGPFTATEMLEWYRAGYFDETLNVRRVCDPQFIELGDLLKACSGSIPFISMPAPPPIIPPLLQSQANEINLSTASSVKPSTPIKPLANPLVHTGKLPPPTSANNPPFFDILPTQNFLGLMNPPANEFLLSNSLPKHPNSAIPTLPNPLSKQTHLKNQHQTQSLQHLLSQHKNDFNPSDSVDPMHHMLNSINHQQISPPVGILPQVPTIPPQTTTQNSPFQTMLMQIRMHNQQQHLQQQIQQHHQQSLIMNAMNSPSLPLPHHSIDETQHQHQPAGIWDLPIPPANVSAPPVVPSSSMKTEMQIIEQFKFENQSAQQLDQWKKQHQALHQPPPQQMPHHQDVQQITPSSLVLDNTPSELLQQTDIFRTKNENIKEHEANRVTAKQAQAKIDTSTGVKQPTSDQLKSNLIKINRNALENDEKQVDKIDTKANIKKPATTVVANVTKPLVNETKVQQKPTSILSSSDVANKAYNNINVINATAAPKSSVKESTKKKSKEKDQKVAEEKRRQQEEEEERKRLELIAAQRKAKLVDQNAIRPEQPKRNNLAASVAPWSNITDNASTMASASPLTLAEIQKAERERRSELYRIEQAQQQNQAIMEQQQQKEVLKWKLKPQQNQAKSLAEIQAEESKARQTIQQISAANAAQQKQQNAKKEEKWASVSQWSMIWGNDGATMASSNGSANCFWEEPAKVPPPPPPSTKPNIQQNGTGKPLAKSQTVSNMQTIANNPKANQNASKTNTTISKTNSSSNITTAANSTPNNSNKKAKGSNANSKKDGDDEFGAWCAKALAAHNDYIDVPTFVSFLRDIESPFEVKDYIRMYLGETKECGEFAKHFLERRSKYKNQQRAANAHIDDMSSPAPALTPGLTSASDGQEAKSKAKKDKKKSKMTKLDSRILGFSVTSAEDRLNVGARDYGGARDGP
ncbi:GIGYF family protein CG11148 isoform X2 [Contarinia nasturtii]|uniref:GIGYF family protein CG11148 isoform X2 n=1 Tax=Contarinia nasturtii TaxID=265458 RepID=UPI0012D4094F|nr:GIGYF family protein CG11148 isoform X2 [Contarinia nasturtii]